MARAILEALGLWALVIVLSFLLTSMVAKTGKFRENSLILGGVTQICFATFSLALMRLLGSPEQYGLTLNLKHTIIATIISIPTALVLAVIAYKLAGGYEPSFLPKDLISRVLLALVLAPIGEEFLFRGLLEGRLLLPDSSSKIGLWIAIVLPAVLFSLVHIMPFSEAPRGYLTSVLASALVMGLLSGYFRAISGSLAPAVASHACFNLIGMLVEKLL